jgi:leader peptidase (prepilin peptidase) / N-methyltransferase
MGFRRSFEINGAYSITWVVFGATIGAVLGSFINCVRYRLPRGISLNRPAYSYCASCGSRLTALDLVPVVSWLCLGGRCRHCRAPIGIGSLLVELICASIGALLVYWLIVQH